MVLPARPARASSAAPRVPQLPLQLARGPAGCFRRVQGRADSANAGQAHPFSGQHPGDRFVRPGRTVARPAQVGRKRRDQRRRRVRQFGRPRKHRDLFGKQRARVQPAGSRQCPDRRNLFRSGQRHHPADAGKPGDAGRLCRARLPVPRADRHRRQPAEDRRRGLRRGARGPSAAVRQLCADRRRAHPAGRRAPWPRHRRLARQCQVRRRRIGEKLFVGAQASDPARRGGVQPVLQRQLRAADQGAAGDLLDRAVRPRAARAQALLRLALDQCEP